MTDAIEVRASRPHAVKWVALAAVPLAAAAIAWFVTRGPRDAAGAAAHATHGAAATGDTARSVMLTDEDARRIGVTYAVASTTPIAREIRTVGQVAFDETRVKTISFKVDGWVEHLAVNFTGQSVGAGVPLLSIYSPMLVTAQEELLLAWRLVTDVRDGDSTARANAASLLHAARRRLAYWDVPAADIRRIEETGKVERTLVLRSPVRGFVVEKNVLQGQRVMAGDALYRIADLSTVWVEGEVFERDLPVIRLGQLVGVELDALPGRIRSGRITYIYPTLNPETRTLRVRVALPNADMLLRPGMYATLTWTGVRTSALSVPRTAVISTGQRHLVFVRQSDGMLEPRTVQVGTFTSDQAEILGGLTAGETVVKSATFLLDAESNLGTLLGGMGNMPGMDMTAPKAPPSRPAPQSSKPAGGRDAHANH